MLHFQLFRIKVYPSKQGFLFESSQTPSEILYKAILSKPTAEFRKGVFWHIGNVHELMDSGLYFRIGKISKSTIEIYNNGNFEEMEFESAPYTHVILDANLEICGIAQKMKLSPRPIGIANRLIRLLNDSTIAHRIHAKFEILPINDPTDFINYLQRALIISKFWITFSRPNAWDVNEDFIKPMEKLAESSGADKGKTEIEGENLEYKNLKELAKSAASTGDDAGASLQMDVTGRKIKKSIKGNHVIIQYQDVTESEQKIQFLQTIKNYYRKIRNSAELNI